MGYEIKRNASGRWVWAHGDELPPATEPRPDGAVFVDDNDGKVYISLAGEFQEVGGGGALPVPETVDIGEVGATSLMCKAEPNLELGQNGGMGSSRVYLADFQPVVSCVGGDATGFTYAIAKNGVMNLPLTGAAPEDCYVTFDANELGTQPVGIGVYDGETVLSAVETYCIVQANVWSPGA